MGDLIDVVVLPGIEVRVKMRAEVCHRCPHGSNLDRDQIEIEFDGADGLIEARSLVEYLARFATREITSEELAQRIRHDLFMVGIDARVTLIGLHVNAAVEIEVLSS